MKLIKHGRNVHELQLEHTNQVAMLSDLHWDNPKCDQELLKKHLDYCKENSIPVMINGDMFCLMQGRGDNRRNKSDIVIGYGNHETAIIKWQETDILQRFVDLLNLKCHSNVQTGGYGGWLIVKLIKHNKAFPFKIKYFHGSGGGGVVTKGALNLTRALEMYEGFDIFTMGHIHENSCRNDVRDSLKYQTKNGYKIEHKYLHSMITGTYKEEYQEGAYGWHVERGAPIKPLGGRILDLNIERKQVDGQDLITKIVDSRRFI